jgi:CHRD domain
MRTVRRLIAVFSVGAALVALGTVPAGALTETSVECKAATFLSPRNEVRTTEVDPVESHAFGFAAIHIESTTLKFAVAIVNPLRETFVAGHIHTGVAGVNGPVLVGLFAGSSGAKFFTQAASIQITAEQADAICGDLAGHYINYHTTQDPMGAVRGQLG